MMPNDKIIKQQENSSDQIDVLVVVDAETLLARYPDANHSPDSPISIEGEFMHILTAGHGESLGRNDSQLHLNANLGDFVHIRGTTLALRGEHIALFYGITQSNTRVMSPAALVVRDNLNLPVPNADSPLQLDKQNAQDHFWRCQLLTHGIELSELCFMIVNQSCAVQGYFRWNLEIRAS
jgi:hypothetical protein